MSAFVRDDGGRAEAGYKGSAGDCGPRAVAIAFAADAGITSNGETYQAVYDELQARQREWIDGTGRGKRVERARAKASQSVRNGTWKEAVVSLLTERGWAWTPTMHIGTGTTVHLRGDELPSGVVLCICSRHYCTVVDGVIRDTYDPSRGGTRAVYGYWRREGVNT